MESIKPEFVKVVCTLILIVCPSVDTIFPELLIVYGPPLSKRMVSLVCDCVTPELIVTF